MEKIGRSAGDIEQDRKPTKHFQPNSFKLIQTTKKIQPSPEDSYTQPTSTTTIQKLKTLITYFFPVLPSSSSSSSASSCPSPPALHKNLHTYIRSCSSSAISKKLDIHLNKLYYMKESMFKMDFDEVEGYILKEWRRSGILEDLTDIVVNGLADVGRLGFGGEFANVREFVGQVCFLYFGMFFMHFSKDTYRDKLLLKLTNRTSYFIITNNKSWLPTLQSLQSTHPPLASLAPPKIDLSQSPLSPYLSKSVFKTCLTPLKKFLQSPKLHHKVTNLLNFRKCLEQQIHSIQTMMIQDGIKSKYHICDKDDFIDCIFRCFQVFDINWDQLDFVVWVLEEIGFQELMREIRGEVYFVDVLAVRNWRVSCNLEIGSAQNISKNIQQAQTAI